MPNDRGKVHVTDVVMVALVSIAVVALAPVYYGLIGDLSEHADPLSALLLQLVVPLLFLGIAVSAGVSARRRA